MSDDHPFMKVLQAAGLYRPEAGTPRPDLSGLPSAPSGDPSAQRYAAKALEYEADIVAQAGEGSRNDTLNRAAFKLGSLVSAGHLDGQDVIDTLAAAARVSGLPAGEINRVVYRAANAGSKQPRQVKLEPRETIAPAHTLQVAPPPPAVNGSAVATSDNATAELVAGIAGNYPALDWPEVFARAPEDVEWVAHPVFEKGRLYSFFSPAKAGKSLLMLDVCAALATGKPVLGQPQDTAHRVLYVDLENSPMDLVERLRDLDYQPDELGRLCYLSFPTLPALDSRLGGEHLLACAMHYKADVVVIDTVSRMIAGGENDSDTFHALYRYAMAPLKALGLTVIRLDHTGKDEEKGMRGSSAKVSDVDVAWKLTKLGNDQVKLERIAARNTNSPEYVMLRQETSPLRHVIDDVPIEDAVASVMRSLDTYGIPTEWGRRKAKEKLTEFGIKVRDTTLQTAINNRRTTFWEAS